ncbi:hypothetical protein [Stieleria marina]|uniref:Uncharacterized protein n=1 Tax=Stieleria marina TaxID=1930275 RepID=A0A517NRA6_9BACT|nr:hypothetical protein K239x_15970 [Planctomycetes bacterium K23_9]
MQADRKIGNDGNDGGMVQVKFDDETLRNARSTRCQGTKEREEKYGMN